MRNYMKGTAIALLLSGTAFASAGTANADDYYHNDRANSTIAVQFGDVSMGYRDGYWDNNHNWHRWNGDNDYQTYRSQHADTYRDWNHDRDSNFGNVSMGYRDGYWDNGHSWHRWNGDNDYQTYRSQHADTYRDWNHDRDNSNGAVVVSFGDVSTGYRDGYWDRERRWHRWGNDGDYRNYRYQHGSNYHDWNHDRDGSTFSIGFGDIAYGYRDGYWDNRHRWHHWRHNRDYRSYRDRDGSNYHDMNHDREDNNGWQR